MRIPAAAAAIPLVAGVLAGVGLAESAGGVLARLAAAASLFAFLSALGAFAHEDDGLVCTAALVTGFSCAGASLGVSAGRQVYRPALLSWFESCGPTEAVTLIGRLREDAAKGAVGPSLMVDVDAVRVRRTPGRSESIDVQGGVRLTVAGQLAAGRIDEWRAGRRIRIVAALRPPAYYLNPGVDDGRRSLARRGVVLVGSVKSAALVEVVARASPAAEAAADIRAWVRRTLAQQVGAWSLRSAAIATAILIGDRTGLDPDDTRRLQEAGTYHVIAISGGNIAVLTALLLLLFRLCTVPARAAAVLTILCLLFYGRITGPAPSVDRAIAAAVLYLGAQIVDQRGSPLNILAVVAVLGVAWSPITLLDPGFVLSFGATLGILIGAGRLTWIPASRRRGWRLLRACASVFAATLSAEAALAPVGAVYFSRVTIAGLLLNFAAIPLMTVVQGSSIVVLAAVPFLRPIATAAGGLAHVAASGLVESARLVEVAPLLTREVVAPAWWLVAAYYLALAVGLARGRRALWPWLAAVSSAVAMLVGSQKTAHEAVASRPGGVLRVVFLDVGQGDATLALLPDGCVLLVDAGGTAAAPVSDGADPGPAGFDVGARVVAPALRAFGVRRLNLFVATHGDPDHIGGAPALIRAFPPAQIWEGVPVPTHARLRMLQTAADAAGATWRIVQAGDVERHGIVTIRVLHPPTPDWERQRVRNDDSVALDLRIGRVSIVLPGDIGGEGEAAAMERLVPAPLVVLKAPHHGSATSSTPRFVSALRPRLVVFSAGRANRFSHPAASVVSRYLSANATPFSTADDGAVILDTDGESLQVTGWTGRVVRMTAW